MAALEESLAAIKGEELSGDGKRETKPKGAAQVVRQEAGEQGEEQVKAKAAK